jgi:hypothetical protein
MEECGDRKRWMTRGGTIPVRSLPRVDHPMFPESCAGVKALVTQITSCNSQKSVNQRSQAATVNKISQSKVTCCSSIKNQAFKGHRTATLKKSVNQRSQAATIKKSINQRSQIDCNSKKFSRSKVIGCNDKKKSAKQRSQAAPVKKSVNQRSQAATVKNLSIKGHRLQQ